MKPLRRYSLRSAALSFVLAAAGSAILVRVRPDLLTRADAARLAAAGVVAIELDLIGDTCAYGTHGLTVQMVGGQKSLTLYNAPYSKFKVGAAVRGASGTIYVGCNVENVSYPEGTCAEAGAIAAMVAAGETELTEAYVIAGSAMPVSPCGGCRQKLAEFGKGDVKVTMATTHGVEQVSTIADLLHFVFDTAHMDGVND